MLRLAWILATCPDVRLRNEPQAYEFALMAISLDGRANAITIDTLAAAQAANGWYEDAVVSLSRIDQIDPAGNSDEIESRKKLYEAERPFYDQAR